MRPGNYRHRTPDARRLWGEERAPILLQLVPLMDGRILDTGGFTVDCFVIATPKASRFHSRAQRAAIFFPTVFRLLAYRTARCADIWRKGEQPF
jgi:hypothetical protein